jgi:hypothetical protein
MTIRILQQASLLPLTNYILRCYVKGKIIQLTIGMILIVKFLETPLGMLPMHL